MAGNAIDTSMVVFIPFLFHYLTENGNGDTVMGYGLRQRTSMEPMRQMSLCRKDMMP